MRKQTLIGVAALGLFIGPTLAQTTKKTGAPSQADIAKCNAAANEVWHAVTSARGKPVWVERDEQWVNKYYECMERFGYEVSKWNGTINGAPGMQPPNARQLRAYYLANGHMAMPALFGGRALSGPIPGLDSGAPKSAPAATAKPAPESPATSADTTKPSRTTQAKGAVKADSACAAFNRCASDTPRAANMGIAASPSVFAKCGAPPAGC
jgi:hypothetical protein